MTKRVSPAKGDGFVKCTFSAINAQDIKHRFYDNNGGNFYCAVSVQNYQPKMCTDANTEQLYQT